MKALNYFVLAAMAISLAACSDNENEPAGNGGKPVAAKIFGNIGGVNSRASGTQWDNDDMIGISATSTGSTEYNNMKYQTTSGDGNFTHVGGDASGIFFQDMEEVNLTAYYPFSGTENTAAGSLDVSTENQPNQKTFDYLYATATASRTNSTASFTFSHKMTRLILNISTDAEAGFTADKVQSGTFYLNGIKHSGTFNTADGTAEATGDKNDNWEINATPEDKDSKRIYSMIFYPQADATLAFKIEIGGVSYGCELNPALAPGTSYSYDISVKKTGLTVSNSTITNWTDGGSQTGSAEMQ